MGVTIVNADAVGVKVSTMIRRADNMYPLWPRVGRFMSRTAAKQFSTKGAWLGTPWKPLKPSYKLWKVRNGYDRRLLIMTGDMKSSFVSRPMDIEKYRKDHAVFGSSDPLALFHQKGTRRNGKRHLPARPILKVTTDMRMSIKEMVHDYVVKGRT